MLRYFLLFAACYVAYKLVFDLIIPVFRASRQVHRQFRSMNEHMQQQANTTQNNRQSPHDPARPSPQAKKADAGEYIDFEEIK